MSSIIEYQEIISAYQRIKPYIYQTDLLNQPEFTQKTSCKFFLKMDAKQKTGAFKIRGVLNHLLKLQEANILPKKIVAYSSGNHALAMAYAGQLFNIQTRIYLPINVAAIKKKAAISYGAEIIETMTRQEAECLAKRDGMQEFHYLPPSDDESVIAGAGTMCYEALEQLEKIQIVPDAIFAPCGGGGLLAGSYLAKELKNSDIKLYGVEPTLADDAYQSLKNKKIFRFAASPDTIADGLRTLSISPRIYHYLQKIDGIELVSEAEINYWTMQITKLTSIICEPSAAIALAAAYNWSLKAKAQNILVLITGSNIESN